MRQIWRNCLVYIGCLSYIKLLLAQGLLLPRIDVQQNLIITHIYIEDMRTKKVSECAVTSERSVLVKIANSNFVPTLRGFRWYPVFSGSGTVSGIRG